MFSPLSNLYLNYIYILLDYQIIIEIKNCLKDCIDFATNKSELGPRSHIHGNETNRWFYHTENNI